MKFKVCIQRPELKSINHPVGNNLKVSIAAGMKMAVALNDIFTGPESFRLVCTGSSGLILSTIIASCLNGRVCEIVHIKKEGEDSHGSSQQVHTYEANALNIIVDDFVASGSTLANIFKEFRKHNSVREIDAVIVNLKCDTELMITLLEEASGLKYDVKTLICEKLI